MSKSMTPDLREEKLPLWARLMLTDLRGEVSDLREQVTVLRGEHVQSNVKALGGVKHTDLWLPQNTAVAFDSNWGRIQVGHDLKGLVRIQGDSSLILRMSAGNALTVELED